MPTHGVYDLVDDTGLSMLAITSRRRVGDFRLFETEVASLGC